MCTVELTSSHVCSNAVVTSGLQSSGQTLPCGHATCIDHIVVPPQPCMHHLVQKSFLGHPLQMWVVQPQCSANTYEFLVAEISEIVGDFGMVDRTQSVGCCCASSRRWSCSLSSITWGQGWNGSLKHITLAKRVEAWIKINTKALVIAKPEHPLIG